MKKFKIALFLLVIVALIILVMGNFTYFSTKQSLQINLLNKLVYTFPAIYNGLYLLGCFVVGILFSLFLTLMAKFKKDKEIKLLKEKVTSQLDRIASLKKEVEFLNRNNSHETQQAATEETVTQS